MHRLPFHFRSVAMRVKVASTSQLGVKRWMALGVCILVLLLSACSMGSRNTGSGGGNTSTTSTTQGTTTVTLGADIASQLKGSGPEDATFTFEQSDAKGSHGPKLGEGVETRTPDLTHQEWTNDPTGTIEQVIDYANAAIYMRIGNGRWDRTPAKIAHYYDLQKPKVLGTETINGVPTYHIRGTAVNDNKPFTMDVWVRTDNLYPVQIWEAYTVGGQTGYYLFVITAYNTGAKISVPQL